jgi:hypothetical protein
MRAEDGELLRAEWRAKGENPPCHHPLLSLETTDYGRTTGFYICVFAVLVMKRPPRPRAGNPMNNHEILRSCRLVSTNPLSYGVCAVFQVVAVNGRIDELRELVEEMARRALPRPFHHPQPER